MHLIRRIALATALLLIVAVAFLWWNKPKTTEMSAYAPADSLVYLEANSLTHITTAVAGTDAWIKLSPILEQQSGWAGPTLMRFSRWTGIGPIQSVIFSRAQVALVMLNLGASEEGESLKVRPEAALLIETHTSSRRIRAFTEETLKGLAENTFGTPSFKKVTTNGVEYLIWSAPTGTRQIVATVADSLVIVGNSEAAVNACLAVRQGKSARLSESPELKQMRGRLSASNALAFGFVSSANAARLATFAAPMLLGRPQTESGFGKIFSAAAAKIAGAIGWSAFLANGGIEDRYLISLQPTVVTRLRPAFDAKATGDVNLPLPRQPYSVSLYNFADPQVAWLSFESAILSQLDALSAAVFSELLRSALRPYGIDDPENFLKLVGPRTATVRLTALSERSVVVGSIRNKAGLQELLAARFPKRTPNTPIMETEDGESAALVIGEMLYLGSTADVGTCLQQLSHGEARSIVDDKRIFRQSTASVVTYADDSDRLRGFVSALMRANRSRETGFKADQIEEALASLRYAITETSLADDGIERRTRSPLGQFGALVAILFPADR